MNLRSGVIIEKNLGWILLNGERGGEGGNT